jgi:hypothetical protein
MTTAGEIIPGFVDLIDKLNERQKDPDPRREYDIWLESRCGRSSETATRPSGRYASIELGVWQGLPCQHTCVKVCVCRVGTSEVRRYTGKGIVPEVVPGVPCGAGNVNLP